MFWRRERKIILINDQRRSNVHDIFELFKRNVGNYDAYEYVLGCCFNRKQ